ncbi:MAG: glycosyl hydrolase family 65 protein [Bacillota bacterium]|nr:glycosyl hydrolase family 65 protein [Bacillota bacterium]
MKLLNFKHPPAYRVDPWRIIEDKFSPENNMLSETLFTVSNGYIGIRGSFEEGLFEHPDRTIGGIYLNGFFESVPIPHAERGYGFAQNTQTLLNVTDSKIIELYLDGERFSLGSGAILSFRRILNMKEGCQERKVVWKSPEGREVQITVTRLVPFKHRHLIVFNYQVIPLNFSGQITLRSSLDGNVDNHTHVEYDQRFSASLGDLRLQVSDIKLEDTGAVIIQETVRSQLAMACAMENRLKGGKLLKADTGRTDQQATTTFQLTANENEKITLLKYVAYFTSRDYPAEKIPDMALETVGKAQKIGFKSLCDEQKEHCKKYWDSAGVYLEGDPKAEQGLRFNLFHLLQASGSNGTTGIPAKGLTSEGYDGHYFWDTEIYMVPFFTSIKPEQARKLLEFRYSILDHARSRARELSHQKGALYPWRTIAGEEGSSYFPASTAQYHINAAIAFAMHRYIEISGDFSLMLDFGAEILFETARLWEDLGTYVPRKGNRFCYNEVTGPDEYSALVNNNCYTNLMAQWHLRYAYQTARYLQQNHPNEFSKLAKKIKLCEEELKAWQRAAEYMYIPYDEVMQIHPQDDGFLDKEVWDFKSTPADNYPLLLHYHPLVIYRFQVCKQPDVILAHLLLSERYSLEQKRRDYNYYEPITTHDSSLSPSIFSIVASELGYCEDAYQYFLMSARLDLENIMKVTHYGIHMANMAGSWMCLVSGFAGMRISEGSVSFNPYMPDNLKQYRFRIRVRGCLLEVIVRKRKARYKLLEGESISFAHQGTWVTLSEGETVNFKLAGQKQQINSH